MTSSGRLHSTLHRALIDERHGPLPALLLGLTVLAGVVDAVSILGLNHVFVATITGNLVFIGLGVAGAAGFSITSPLVAVGGFVVGVLLGARACRFGGDHRGLALRNVIVVKAVLALVVVLIAVIAGSPFGAPVRGTVTVLLAASMGAQLAAIRYLKVPDLLTVVLTLTITGVLTERGGGWNDPAVLRRALALIAFAVGTICGGLLVRLVSLAAALTFGLLIILVVGVATHQVSRTPSDWSVPAGEAPGRR